MVLEALECESARLFSERASPEERLELVRMAEHMDVLVDRAANGDDDREFIYVVNSYHFNLHMRIAECARCGALHRAIEKNQILIFNWLFVVRAGQQVLPPRFHRELLDAISGIDPAVAETAMRKHLRYGLEEILRDMKPRISGEWRLRRPHALPDEAHLQQHASN